MITVRKVQKYKQNVHTAPGLRKCLQNTREKCILKYSWNVRISINLLEEKYYSEKKDASVLFSLLDYNAVSLHHK